MLEIVTIADKFDPRLAAYRQIRERDLIAQEHFIAEGEVVLRVLMESRRFTPVSLLIADKRIDRLMPVLGGLPPGIPVYRAAQDVLDTVAGFHIHRGILALGRRVAPESATILLERVAPEAVILVLFGIANHDNIGGIFRNAAGFGAACVLLDPQCCDPLYRKAIRVSVGASLIVPFARLAPGQDPFALLNQFGFDALALTPSGAVSLKDLARRRRAAVLLGTEGPGLPREILERAETVAIPMAPGFDSLNVATTSGIVLHHLLHSAKIAGEN